MRFSIKSLLFVVTLVCLGTVTHVNLRSIKQSQRAEANLREEMNLRYAASAFQDAETFQLAAIRQQQHYDWAAQQFQQLDRDLRSRFRDLAEQVDPRTTSGRICLTQIPEIDLGAHSLTRSWWLHIPDTATTSLLLSHPDGSEAWHLAAGINRVSYIFRAPTGSSAGSLTLTVDDDRIAKIRIDIQDTMSSSISGGPSQQQDYSPDELPISLVDHSFNGQTFSLKLERDDSLPLEVQLPIP